MCGNCQLIGLARLHRKITPECRQSIRLSFHSRHKDRPCLLKYFLFHSLSLCAPGAHVSQAVSYPGQEMTVTPAGAFILDSMLPSFFFLWEIWTTPKGVGKVPFAHDKFPRWGFISSLVQPGSIILMPRTFSVSQGVTPDAQPWHRPVSYTHLDVYKRQW